MANICMVVGCEIRRIYSRGLCHPHYQVAARLVRESKKITWEELEKSGKVLPAKVFGPGQNISEARSYFLGRENG